MNDDSSSQRDDSDLLYGVPAIASFLGIGQQAARHLARLRRITTFRMGRRLCARKSTLRSDFAALEEQAKTAPVAEPSPPPVLPSAASLLRPRRR